MSRKRDSSNEAPTKDNAPGENPTPTSNRPCTTVCLVLMTGWSVVDALVYILEPKSDATVVN